MTHDCDSRGINRASSRTYRRRQRCAEQLVRGPAGALAVSVAVVCHLTSAMIKFIVYNVFCDENEWDFVIGAEALQVQCTRPDTGSTAASSRANSSTHHSKGRGRLGLEQIPVVHMQGEWWPWECRTQQICHAPDQLPV